MFGVGWSYFLKGDGEEYRACVEEGNGYDTRMTDKREVVNLLEGHLMKHQRRL